jgi:hypothetical protein
MSMIGRRVIIIVFILAGVILPLWQFVSKNMDRPPDDLLSSPPAEIENTEQDKQARPRDTPLFPPSAVAVRLPPPPPSPSPSVSGTIFKEPVRVTPLKATEAKFPAPLTVAPLKPVSVEREKSSELMLTTLKPNLQEMVKNARKPVRTLRPSRTRTEPRQKKEHVRVPVTEKKKPIQTVRIRALHPAPTRSKSPPKIKTVNVPLTEQKKPDQIVELQVRPSAPEIRKGRRLLKLLEHGQGPTIEITWPRNVKARTRLFGYLSTCYGMQTALLDGDGRLYMEGGRRGRKWAINLDRFSGFVRQPDSIIAPAERRAAEKVRLYHGLIPAAHVVRVFPRVVDAALLGGLKRLMGDAYSRARTIRGQYRETPGGLIVEAIAYEGGNIVGAISFPPVGGSSCR